MAERITLRQPASLVQIDFNNIEDFTQIEAVSIDCSRALLSPASPAAYWLAALPYMGDFAQEFLKQVDKYIQGSCTLPLLPADWTEDGATHQLHLFVHEAQYKVSAEPVAAVSLRDASEELLEVLKSVNAPRTLSGLARLVNIFQRQLKRLAIDASPREGLDERAHQLLSAGNELAARLKRYGFYRESPLAMVEVYQRAEHYWAEDMQLHMVTVTSAIRISKLRGEISNE